MSLSESIGGSAGASPSRPEHCRGFSQRYNYRMSESFTPGDEIALPAAETHVAQDLPAVETTPAEAPLPPARPKVAWRRRLGRIAVLGTGALALAAGAGFAGRFWWLFAVADIFRVQYFWGFLVGTTLLLMSGRRRAAFMAAVLLALHAWLLWPFYAAPPAPRPAIAASPASVRLRVVTLNVWGRNKQYERVFDFLRQTK